jgi:hypothetical protein
MIHPYPGIQPPRPADWMSGQITVAVAEARQAAPPVHASNRITDPAREDQPLAAHFNALATSN